MGSNSGKVYVTKLAAARRQLCAAIRMFFAGEDELAIHSVASAAYQVLIDLKAKRGRDEAADHNLIGVFYSVRAYRRGTLPDDMLNDPEMMRFIRDMADGLPTLTAFSDFKDFAASVSPDVANKFWKNRTVAANFLKHANRDAKSLLSLNEIDNLMLLTQAHGAYCFLSNENLGPEGFVLGGYFIVVKNFTEGISKEFLSLTSILGNLGPDERLKYCSELLSELKEADVGW